MLSSEEVQERLGISRPTLYLWVRQKKLHPRRAGRALRFDEDDVLRLLGRSARVEAWIRRGPLSEARREVQRAVRTGSPPSYLLEYLESPKPDFLRLRVVSAGDGGEIRSAAPGGVAFEALLASMRRLDFVFLSHEDSIWRIRDLRSETTAGGDPYIAMELGRPEGPGEGDERGRRLREFVQSMREGIIRGDVTYERGSG